MAIFVSCFMSSIRPLWDNGNSPEHFLEVKEVVEF